MRIGLAWILLLSAQLSAGAARAREWTAIDALRARLEAGGAKGVRDDCSPAPTTTRSSAEEFGLAPYR